MDNRARLLDCAQDLFAARGYDAVGVQEVVEAAGVTKPTLYHYFTHKRGLLEALLAERFAPFDAALSQACIYKGDLTISLRGMAQAYFDFALANPRFYRMALSMQFASPESEPYQAVSRFSLEQFSRVESLFTQAAEMHGNMRGRQRLYAASFIGMMNTCIGMFLNDSAALDANLVYQATHQFMHGILS